MELLDFIKNSPSSFHAIKSITNILDENGFEKIEESENWRLEKNKKYYVVRNLSSVIAFSIGNVNKDFSFKISASHSDFPCFKLKPNSLLVNNQYVTLNTEVYGSPIFSTWYDRVLSIAGRVVTSNEQGVYKSELVNIDKDLLVIPNVAPHLNPTVLNDMKHNPQIDLIPLMAESNDTSLNDLLKQYVKEKIICSDLFLYVRDRGHIFGANNEYINAPQLDDLACAFGTLKGFINSKIKGINVYCCFDNEEVGSNTKQGAGSNFLESVLKRICLSLNLSEEDMYKNLANSFFISADNAHAVHPNHPEKTDSINKAYMNNGVVIKYNSNQRYTTDSISSMLFKEICCNSGCPYQEFTNRSDIRGGSTLGTISISHISINSVDIGLPQLAMHSAMETMGAKDIFYLEKSMQEFFSNEYKCFSNKIMIV